MVVDASAVLAAILGEVDAAKFDVALSEPKRKLMSAINYWEVLVRAYGLHGQPGVEAAEELLGQSQVEVVAADKGMARAAAEAFQRFGRRTPAGLNLGDCFAYALAQKEGDGLLFKGADFTKTDVRSAL